jgi:hypothetical protein
MMFKSHVIQAMDNLSDERAEFLIDDRMSFMRFHARGLSNPTRRASEKIKALADVDICLIRPPNSPPSPAGFFMRASPFG